MARVLLGVGSNLRRYTHVSLALDALQDRFGKLLISPVYESEAVGFQGDPFLNLVVSIETSISVGALSAWLKALEDVHGRDRSTGRYSGRTLDIDILAYADLVGMVDGVELPRAEVLTNAFVLRPLSNLLPKGLHPQLKRSYAELWAEYNCPQRLWPVVFKWRGGVIRP